MSYQHYNLYKRNKINIIQFVFGPFQENTFVIWSENNQQAIVIDPGMSNGQEENIFQNALQEHNLILKAIYNTHCHIDHIMGVGYLQKKDSIVFYHHPTEESNIHRSSQMSALWNIPYSPPIEKGKSLTEGETWQIGEEIFEVIEVPGHCEGHLAFIHHDSKTIFSGDVIFRESIGRTDLPGGNIDVIQNSIYRLYTFPNEYVIFNGHGPETTIGHEKNHNPFFPLR
jgi:glyoxylase-like metal-dependent hydrolase (beta-lactamase superfamily II)